MKINLNNIEIYNECPSIYVRKIYNKFELIDGTYSIDLQKRLIDENKNKCDTFLLKENKKDVTIGILSVMYRGGNELEYKIRNIDAFIYNVMIKKEYRGKGHIREMIAYLGKVLKYQKITEAYLAVSVDNKNAIKAYEKIGFESVKEAWFIRMLRKNIPYYTI